VSFNALSKATASAASSSAVPLRDSRANARDVRKDFSELGEQLTEKFSRTYNLNQGTFV
jgi:hypothetical protein